MKNFRMRDYVIAFMVLFLFQIVQLFELTVISIFLTVIGSLIIAFIVGTITNKLIHK